MTGIDSGDQGGDDLFFFACQLSAPHYDRVCLRCAYYNRVSNASLRSAY